MPATDRAYKNARALRRRLTLSEKLLWARLRRGPAHIRRQHPLDPFVLDFYCASSKIAIEVDGYHHEVGCQPVRDERRDAWLRSLGLKIVRIPARHVLADPDAVAEAILLMCAAPDPSTTQQG